MAKKNDKMTQSDLKMAWGILDKAAEGGFVRDCSVELKQAFEGRLDVLAKILAKLSKLHRPGQTYPESGPWSQAASAPPHADPISQRASVAEATLREQDRWGRHLLSLMPLGLAPIPSHFWRSPAMEGKVRSVHALEAIGSVWDLRLGERARFSSGGGFAAAFEKDGEAQLDLVAKWLAEGRFDGERPILSICDFLSVGAVECAKALEAAGVAMRPSVYGPHGEHGLLPIGGRAARLWLKVGRSKSGISSNDKLRQELSREIANMERASREGRPGCSKADILADLHILRERVSPGILSAGAKRKAISVVDAFELSAEKLEGSLDGNVRLAEAIGKSMGKTLWLLQRRDDIEAKSEGNASIGKIWRAQMQPLMDMWSSRGFDFSRNADELASSILRECAEYASATKAGIMADVAFEVLGEHGCVPGKHSGCKTLAWLGDRGLVKQIMALAGQGASLGFDDPERGTLLHMLAERKGSAEKKLWHEVLAKHPELASSVAQGGLHKGMQPLHLAAKALDVEMIEALLDKGADPNARDAEGQTPLRYLLSKRGAAADRVSEQIAKKFIERGADPALRDDRGRTPAQAASRTASFSALTMLFASAPEDLTAGGKAGTEARARLRSRTGGGSLLEQVALREALGPEQDDRAEKKGKQASKNRL